MTTKNKVHLIGHLGQNPKIVETESGQTIMSVSMATDESYKDKDGNRKERTEWHNIVAFGKLAGIFANHTKKGSKLLLWGRLQTRSYEHKDGSTRYVTEIVAEEILFLDNKPD